MQVLYHLEWKTVSSASDMNNDVGWQFFIQSTFVWFLCQSVTVALQDWWESFRKFWEGFMLVQKQLIAFWTPIKIGSYMPPFVFVPMYSHSLLKLFKWQWHFFVWLVKLHQNMKIPVHLNAHRSLWTTEFFKFCGFFSELCQMADRIQLVFGMRDVLSQGCSSVQRGSGYRPVSRCG